VYRRRVNLSEVLIGHCTSRDPFRSIYLEINAHARDINIKYNICLKSDSRVWLCLFVLYVHCLR
jgi:hypothetical protein